MNNTTNPNDKPKIHRRRFLQVLVSIFGAIWSVLTLYPIYRYLKPKKNPLEEAQVNSVTVGDASSLPTNSGKNFQFGSVPGLVIHAEDNQFHAFDAICTHMGCTVQYRPDLKLIWCACHGGEYDPETGKNVAGPPPRPLTPFKVAIVQGKLVVSKG